MRIALPLLIAWGLVSGVPTGVAPASDTLQDQAPALLPEVCVETGDPDLDETPPVPIAVGFGSACNISLDALLLQVACIVDDVLAGSWPPTLQDCPGPIPGIPCVYHQPLTCPERMFPDEWPPACVVDDALTGSWPPTLADCPHPVSAVPCVYHQPLTCPEEMFPVLAPVPPLPVLP